MPKFVPRQRKHKARVRNGKSETRLVEADSNATEILPVSKIEKEKERQRLKDELRAQQPKFSTKKQKRLDKYIENKLKKDENLALLQKLSKSKSDVSGLQSSRNLRKHFDPTSHVQPSSKLELETISKESISTSSSSDGLDQHPEDSGGEVANPNAKETPYSSNTKPTNAPLQAGIGLKRPLSLGDDGFPVFAVRKAKKRKTIAVEEIPWEGFSSDEEQTGEIGVKDESRNDLTRDTSGEDEMSSIGESSNADFSDYSAEQKSKKSRISAFKEWATQQINEALDLKPSGNLVTTQHSSPKEPKPAAPFVPREPEREPLPRDLQVDASKIARRKAFSVLVNRPRDVVEARLSLPIVAEEQKIMEAIYNNPVVVIWGATGSGKTTQVPQFLFEAGFGDPNSPTPGMIAVTQPRRVAAVSMARRVADELGEHKDKVAYQIRFEHTMSSNTAIKFMTDGVLLREVTEDFALRKYSVVVIDEAHERSVNTDILIGMIGRIVDLRETLSETDDTIKPLKFVIMSATLRIADFMQNPHLFRRGQPPLVEAEGRQYPVTIHFSRRTNRDYVEEASRKVIKGHQKLPPGAMLVFLTGQNEIKDLTSRLMDALPSTGSSQSYPRSSHISTSDAPPEIEDFELGESRNDFEEDDDSDVEFNGLDDDKDDGDFEIGEESMSSTTRVHILPLYSQLSTKDQLKIFKAPPEGSRLIVIATNVAETSLTIPGIRYVFDCGRSKEKHWDQATGVQSFEIGWISKASANQRAGRAGRTGPGHCYRLYSSAVYEREFQEHTKPEILRTPIEGVVLQMKSIGLHNVVNFPFPTPPDRDSLVRAEKLLQNLGALSLGKEVTKLGQGLSIYPLSPRYSKMLHIGNQHGCLPYVIALVAALSVSDIFVPENQLDIHLLTPSTSQPYTTSAQIADTNRESLRAAYKKAHRLFSKYDLTSDALKLLTATCAYAYAPDPDSFCADMFLRAKAMKEVLQLRRQLYDIVRSNHRDIALGPFNAQLPEPSEKQVKSLKQILATGFIDQVAIRADLSPSPPDLPQKPKRSIDVPFFTLLPSHFGSQATDTGDPAAYIHPSSLLTHTSTKSLPQYLIYSTLQRSTQSTISSSKTPKTRLFPLTSMSGAQLAALAHGTPLVEYSKPIGKIVTLEGKPERRECVVVPSLVGEKGKLGWPLPARKVIERKEVGKVGWVVERFLS